MQHWYGTDKLRPKLYKCVFAAIPAKQLQFFYSCIETMKMLHKIDNNNNNNNNN